MPAEPPRAGQKHNILVAVSGQTPAIITETLWALQRRGQTEVDQVRVITTSKGRESIIRTLLGDSGKFTSFCRDYHIPPGRIAFSEKDIYVLRGPRGEELEDIRDTKENAAAADQVFSLIREWTRREDEVLFCSAAGGRKTLGIYLAMSLMLCGRLCDSLSHVLAAPAFETGVPGFFYPPPAPCAFERIVGAGPNGSPVLQPVSSEEARVELADIPFPRLRELIGGELPLEKGLSEAVTHSQMLLSCLQSPRFSSSISTAWFAGSGA
jgi:CRISPR-associated protein (TIGR02584 family)